MLAVLLGADGARGEMPAGSGIEAINYGSFVGATLAASNLWVTLNGLQADPNGNILVAELDGGVMKLTGTTGDLGGNYFSIAAIPEVDGRTLGIVGLGAVMLVAVKRRRMRIK